MTTVLGRGDSVPDVGVWLAPGEEPISLARLHEDGPYLLFFYLYDWSAT